MRLRRLTRFRLRTLLLLVAAVAVLAGSLRRVVDRYHVEQAALQQLKGSRFPVTAKLARPWWIADAVGSRFARVFDRVVHLSIAGPTLDFERGLALNPRNFDDDDVHLLATFRKLRCLDLSGTLVGPDSVDELVRLRSVTALDVTGTQVSAAALSEFQRRRPDCFVCDSQPNIVAQLHSDGTITVGKERGNLNDVAQMLTRARRGPDAFGYTPMLYIIADEDLVRQRAQVIRTVRQAAIDAGYQRIQVGGF